MTKEQRAQIARANGAKSRGPKTKEGKAKSSRNALKAGTRAKKLAHFVPPHEAVLCHEDRKYYAHLIADLCEIYAPKSQTQMDLIRDIAIARTQIDRLHRCVTIHWNLALIDAANGPSRLAPELRELENTSTAIVQLLCGDSMLMKLNREIARLQQSLVRAERLLRHYSERTPQMNPTFTANKPLTENEPPIFIRENQPEVIAFFRRHYPARPIVVTEEAA
ncbi:MAG: hypothetical protein HYX27_27635 [Acidobacteria bacterium]|nr:hypothetical protein [Acidobacteriota bacterium]